MKDNRTIGGEDFASGRGDGTLLSREALCRTTKRFAPFSVCLV
jgi:hypothetical protein